MIDKLRAIGFSQREADAYLTLLQEGESTASQIAKRTKEHRTNVYDSLNSLIKKGIIAKAIKDNVLHFSACDPQSLKSFILEKQEICDELLVEIKTMTSSQEKPIIQVYEGSEGFKTVLGLILREKSTIYGIAASGRWEEEFKSFLAYYMKSREKDFIRAKLLYTPNVKLIVHRLNEIRILPLEYALPSTIIIFGDKVATLMWTQPLVATVTQCKSLARTHLDYFNLLWKQSKVLK